MENAFQAFRAMEPMHNGMFGMPLCMAFFFQKRIKGATLVEAVTIEQGKEYPSCFLAKANTGVV